MSLCNLMTFLKLGRDGHIITFPVLGNNADGMRQKHACLFQDNGRHPLILRLCNTLFMYFLQMSVEWLSMAQPRISSFYAKNRNLALLSTILHRVGFSRPHDQGESGKL